MADRPSAEAHGLATTLSFESATLLKNDTSDAIAEAMDAGQIVDAHSLSETTASILDWNLLPAEIQLQIISYLVPIGVRFAPERGRWGEQKYRLCRDYAFRCYSPEGDFAFKQLLTVNKAISIECLKLLYGENVFMFMDGAREVIQFGETVGDQNSKIIRQLYVQFPMIIYDNESEFSENGALYFDQECLPAILNIFNNVNILQLRVDVATWDFDPNCFPRKIQSGGELSGIQCHLLESLMARTKNFVNGKIYFMPGTEMVTMVAQDQRHKPDKGSSEIDLRSCSDKFKRTWSLKYQETELRERLFRNESAGFEVFSIEPAKSER